MFKESNILRKVQKENQQLGNELKYSEKAYEGLSSEAEARFKKKRKKELGFSYIEGDKESSLLISSAHATNLVDTNLEVEKDSVEKLNEVEGVNKRYVSDKNGKLLIGKTYLNAAVRERKSGDYKADSMAGLLCVELQD